MIVLYISVIMSIMCEIRKGHRNLWKCVNILLYHSCKSIKWIKILCKKRKKETTPAKEHNTSQLLPNRVGCKVNRHDQRSDCGGVLIAV